MATDPGDEPVERKMPWGNRLVFWFARHGPDDPFRRATTRSGVVIAFAVCWLVLATIWSAVMLLIGGVRPKGATDAEWFAWQPSLASGVTSAVLGSVVLGIGLAIFAVTWPLDGAGDAARRDREALSDDR